MGLCDVECGLDQRLRSQAHLSIHSLRHDGYSTVVIFRVYNKLKIKASPKPAHENPTQGLDWVLLSKPAGGVEK